jgi:hypothetical protein
MLKAMARIVSRGLERALLEAWGRFLYFRDEGRHDLAAAALVFRRLLEVAPSSFSAHLYLGRIAHVEGRQAAAIAAFATCHRLNVARFRRAAIPQELKDEILWRDSVTRDADGVWQAIEGSGTAERRTRSASGAVRIQNAPDGAANGNFEIAAGVPPHTDFSSAVEARRFAELPPISKEEVEDVDWDEVLDNLTRD